jgi:dihydroorotate dehydrogenase (NAD+) catalytic subunit
MGIGVDLNGLTLKTPIIGASGTCGYGSELGNFYGVKDIGAIVTKAITLSPKSGNDWQRIFEVPGGLINSIGLENIGIEKFLSEKLPLLRAENIEFIVNIAGSNEEEYLKLAEICDKNSIGAIELNLSCPNVKSGCLMFGIDEKISHALVAKVRERFSGHLIAKLSPNVTSIEGIATAVQVAGANAISAINTVRALAMKLSYCGGSFRKNFIRGGMSGKAIKPIALGVVERISKVVDIPLIGIGGIYNLEDVLEFFAVGADAVQIGTANFTNPNTCEKLAKDLREFMKTNGFDALGELKRKLREEIT